MPALREASPPSPALRSPTTSVGRAPPGGGLPVLSAEEAARRIRSLQPCQVHHSLEKNFPLQRPNRPFFFRCVHSAAFGDDKAIKKERVLIVTAAMVMLADTKGMVKHYMRHDEVEGITTQLEEGKKANAAIQMLIKTRRKPDILIYMVPDKRNVDGSGTPDLIRTMQALNRECFSRDLPYDHKKAPGDMRRVADLRKPRGFEKPEVKANVLTGVLQGGQDEGNPMGRPPPPPPPPEPKPDFASDAASMRSGSPGTPRASPPPSPIAVRPLSPVAGRKDASRGRGGGRRRQSSSSSSSSSSSDSVPSDFRRRCQDFYGYYAPDKIKGLDKQLSKRRGDRQALNSMWGAMVKAYGPWPPKKGQAPPAAAPHQQGMPQYQPVSPPVSPGSAPGWGAPPFFSGAAPYYQPGAIPGPPAYGDPRADTLAVAPAGTPAGAVARGSEMDDELLMLSRLAGYALGVGRVVECGAL